jgi:Protein of unknown function (DUF3027)
VPAIGVDAAAASAVDLARAAAVEVGGESAVGEHIGCAADDERVLSHEFASLLPGYVGWMWSVTVARVSRSRVITVDDVCLLPGADALLAPAWLPYEERLRPGDLGPGDLLPTPDDDDRLEPGWSGGFATLADRRDAIADLRQTVYELGVVRNRVLSLTGMDDAVDRWVNGSGGPHVPLAESAPAHCSTCGFLVQLGGLLGHAFGVCANEYSPSDGHVVSGDHGCGAHSEAGRIPSLAQTGAPVLDEIGYDSLGHG